MEVEPNDLLLFARIVEAGSFSQAAARVNLPKSTVSRRISLLEARLGERLLQRTTRKLVVTEFGASLLEHARKVAEEAEAAGALAQHRQAAPAAHRGEHVELPGLVAAQPGAAGEVLDGAVPCGAAHVLALRCLRVACAERGLPGGVLRTGACGRAHRVTFLGVMIS